MQDATDQQIATEGDAASLRPGTGDTPCVLAPQQPAQVHSAPALRTARAQGPPRSGLPRRGGAVGRHARAGRGAGPEGDPALHHAAEGLGSAAAHRARAAVAGEECGAVPPKKSRRPIELAAADSTGMDTCRASRYFVRRRKNYSKIQELVAYSTFPKLEMVCDCRSHLILCADVVVGPTVDVDTFRKLLFGTLRVASVGTILADAGYDSESNHRFARDGCGVRSVIPPK